MHRQQGFAISPLIMPVRLKNDPGGKNPCKRMFTRGGATHTELANKVCPGLHDSACWRSGEITPPSRTHFFGQPCRLLLNRAPGGDIIVIFRSRPLLCLQIGGKEGQIERGRGGEGHCGCVAKFKAIHLHLYGGLRDPACCLLAGSTQPFLHILVVFFYAPASSFLKIRTWKAKATLLRRSSS